MKYCMDASALIDLGERHYPERVPLFKPIWEHLYDGIDNGSIISVDYVKIEMSKKADQWRTDFFSRADHMFHISDAIEHEYARLISDIESDSIFRENKAREKFLSGADPWVIAMARHSGECTVVSGEKKSLADYGLGAVSKHLEVKHMDVVQFIEANNIGA